MSGTFSSSNDVAVMKAMSDKLPKELSSEGRLIVEAIIKGNVNAVIGSNATTLYTSFGTKASDIIKLVDKPNNITVKLFAIIAENINLAPRWLQIFDNTTAPAANEVPLLEIPIYGASPVYALDGNTLLGYNNGVSIIDQNVLGTSGLNFSKGLTFGFSTTPKIYTPGNGNDLISTFRYA